MMTLLLNKSLILFYDLKNRLTFKDSVSYLMWVTSLLSTIKRMDYTF